jgi:sodium/potassium-transporting ATPase subunit alpha
MQWFNLLAIRTRRLSIFQQNPIFGKDTRNLWLFAAMPIALILGMYVSDDYPAQQTPLMSSF